MRNSVKTAVVGAFFAGIAPSAAFAEMRACTVILDVKSGKTLIRQGNCDERLSPASSFKAALALIGYDARLLKDAHTPKLRYRTGSGSSMQDRAEADPEIWMKASLLWYSRELTRQLGEKRFAEYVRRLGYGNADLSGDKGSHNGLTKAWIDSSLKISPNEQAAFMRRFARCELPVTAYACDNAANIMPHFTTSNGWAVRGKTGTVLYRGDKTGLRTGWFVGWAERDGRMISFARMGDQIGSVPQPAGPQARDDFLRELPTLIK